MNNHSPNCLCVVCEQRETIRRRELLNLKAAIFDEMREALAKVLMVSLLPNDISGRRMVQEARDTLSKANEIVEACNEH